MCTFSISGYLRLEGPDEVVRGLASFHVVVVDTFLHLLKSSIFFTTGKSIRNQPWNRRMRRIAAHHHGGREGGGPQSGGSHVTPLSSY